MVSRKAPLHERIRPLGWVRGRLRRLLFQFLSRLAGTDDMRDIMAGSLRGLLRATPALPVSGEDLADLPYPDLGEARTTWSPSPCSPIFITARFRTGSTLLWNIFRHLEGCTAYYEPLNERRWFDPGCRGDRKDPTHRNVADYWREYERLEGLAEYYRERWAFRQLLMDEHDWDPCLRRYIEILIERASGRPVLQFNRVDFRLPWLRRNFPSAKLVHLYRHPRDQWCSTLADVTRFPKDGGTAEFAAHDDYYLLSWARDLKHHFPFLDERLASHPYQIFYYLWRLSYLFGKRYADYSLSFEELVQDPEATLVRLFAALNVIGYDLDMLKSLVDPPQIGSWRRYADASWFEQHEAFCERELATIVESTCSAPRDGRETVSSSSRFESCV